jgi:hypothetical protein
MSDVIETKEKETDWDEVAHILEAMRDMPWHERLRGLRGKIHFTEPLEAIREDRD